MRIAMFIVGLVFLLAGLTAIVYLDLNLTPFISWGSLAFVVISTFGITMLIFSPSLVISSLKNGTALFFALRPSLKNTSQKILQLAALSRSDGLLAMERITVEDDFLARGVRLALQGNPEKNVAAIMNIELKTRLFRLRQSMRVLYCLTLLAPMFGFVGTLAVIVAQNLPAPDLPLGGIMLPTLYGFILSAFFFMPLIFRLREEACHRERYSDFIMSGLSCIINGEHPSLVQEKLMACLVNCGNGKNLKSFRSGQGEKPNAGI